MVSTNLLWPRERLKLSREIECKDPTAILDWLDQRRKEIPFTAELIPLREAVNWRQDDKGNFYNTAGQFFRIELCAREAPL